MTDIADGARQYTINTLESFESLELVKLKILKYNIRVNHGKQIRYDQGGLGLNPFI